MADKPNQIVGRRGSKILIIGANGIGSFFLRGLDEAITKGHLNTSRNAVVVADNDTVEAKNVAYALYTPRDIGGKKSVLNGLRYGFIGKDKRILEKETIDEMKPDLIIMAADNNKVRRLVLESGYPFIDMRAEGRIVMVFDMTGKQDERPKEKYLKLTPESDSEGSCQRTEDIMAGTIQYGNRVAAEIGMQVLMNWLRMDAGPSCITLAM
jgi:hypothetical protein